MVLSQRISISLPVDMLAAPHGQASAMLSAPTASPRLRKSLPRIAVFSPDVLISPLLRLVCRMNGSRDEVWSARLALSGFHVGVHRRGSHACQPAVTARGVGNDTWKRVDS